MADENTEYRPTRQGDDATYEGLCPRCRSNRWVSVSLNGGFTRIPQCIPCGAYHDHALGPGWRGRRGE
jgi:hypothetical protein